MDKKTSPLAQYNNDNHSHLQEENNLNSDKTL